MTLDRHTWLAITGMVLALGALSAPAQTSDTASVAELRAEIERLKAEHAAQVAETQRLEARLLALESSLGSGEHGAAPQAAVAVTSPPATKDDSRFEFSSDFRLRYEGNYGDSDARDWDRGVLRARLRASYAVNDWLTVGGALATGDSDDPNSTDVTLSNFDDDLELSLDQAYAKADFGNLDLWGGKFPLPFARTELVWDGDVNPQGLSGVYRLPFANGSSLRLSSLYFLVDHSVAGSDSSMLGNQLAFEGPLTDSLRLEAAAGYYDYSLAGVAGADGGDFRSNLIGPDGRYVSDFNLLDGILALTYTGAGDRWPIRLSGEYVNNRGARTSGDTGHSIDVSAGRASQRGDWRFSYGYSVAEVDAVLAAFSHDNTTIASNYRQHSLSVAHVLLKNLILDATLYRYRPYDADFAGANDPDDWLDRLRLNFLVNF
jgi:hypothetical protein